MSDPAVPPGNTPHHEGHHNPDEIDFDGLLGRPTHHYVIWAFIVLAFVGGIYFSFKDQLFPPKVELAAAPVPPRALSLEVTPGPDGVAVTNTMTMQMVEAKATIVTASGAEFSIWMDRLPAGQKADMKFGSFKNRTGWALNPKNDQPTIFRIESFGMKIEKPLVAPAPPATAS
jgi:hypothetical protein